MAIGSIDTVSSALSAALQGRAAANTNTPLPPVDQSQQAAETIISQSSTTSLNGQVTTITTYADGTVKTTISDGDVVIISANAQHAA